MKRSLLLTMGCLLGLAGYSSAQGLLGISPEVGDPKILPLSYGVSAGFGYDSNVNTTSSNETSSTFGEASARTRYANGTDRTYLTLDLSGGLVHYFDQDEGFDDTFYNARFGVGLSHAFTSRLLMRNNAYVSYQIEPDYRIGQSISRRSDQFWFLYNSLMFDYAWTERVSTTTGYDIQYVNYENALVGAFEDRTRHQFLQNIRYALTQQTGIRGEYRFGYTDYKSGAEATSHYALGGIDHAIDEFTAIIVMVGAEFRETRGRGIDSDKVAPFAEVGLTRDLDDRSSLRWANRLGYEDSQIGLHGTNYSYRSSLDYLYQLTSKVTSNIGLVYNHAKFEGGPAGSRKDNIFVISLGLEYAIRDNVGIGAGYNFTTLNSNAEAQDYDRHRVNMSVNASF